MVSFFHPFFNLYKKLYIIQPGNYGFPANKTFWLQIFVYIFNFFAKMNKAKKYENYAKFGENAKISRNYFRERRIPQKPEVLQLQQLIVLHKFWNSLLRAQHLKFYYIILTYYLSLLQQMFDEDLISLNIFMSFSRTYARSLTYVLVHCQDDI